MKSYFNGFFSTVGAMVIVLSLLAGDGVHLHIFSNKHHLPIGFMVCPEACVSTATKVIDGSAS